MGIGCVVNAIVWFNLLWLNRKSVIAQLRAMDPSSKVVEAIRWMELDLPKSQMPMIASRLEEIIDSIKMNGKSVERATRQSRNSVIPARQLQALVARRL